MKRGLAWMMVGLLLVACPDDGGGSGEESGSTGETGATMSASATAPTTTAPSSSASGTGDTTADTTAGPTDGSSSSTTGEDVAPLADAKLLIEHNATDEDTGFQGFADGVPWNELTLEDGNGDPVLGAQAGGGLLDWGLTEWFFETSEPANDDVPIEDTLDHLPAGDYTYASVTVDDLANALSTALTHDIPAGPEITAPVDGVGGLDPDNVVVTWEAVTETIDGGEVTIVGYEVIVEEDSDDLEFPDSFARPVLSAHLPEDATSLTVPLAFLANNGCYKVEVLALETSGNQTLSSVEFETGSGCGGGGGPPPPPGPLMTQAKLLIEHNATDEDTGFQGFADGDPWNELTITDPDDTVILTVTPRGGLQDFGLTELFFETNEPPNSRVSIPEVLARLSEGTYTFSGEMVGGDPSQITATFSHVIPAGPVLLTPVPDADDVDPDDTVVSWEEVIEDVNGDAVDIIGYQVTVEAEIDDPHPAGFGQPFYSIYLPATETSTVVPAEFMAAATDYEYEVLAIEESGNQTLSAATFTTQ